MNRLTQLWRRILYYWRRETFDRDLQEEMQLHLESKVRENLAAGMPAREARYVAQREFGNQTLIRESSRDLWNFKWIDALIQDLRFGARRLIKDRAFTAVVIMTLALGIGANTAIFSVVNTVLLRPLPYGEPDRLVMVWTNESGGKTSPAPIADFVDWRAQNHVFSDMAAMDPNANYSLTGIGEPERLSGARVSTEFFSLLDSHFLLGRGFSSEDGRLDRDYVVILDYEFWRRRFGADPTIIGRKIALNDSDLTVVGVLSPDFRFVAEPADFLGRTRFDVWLPIKFDPAFLPKQRGSHPLRTFARLRPGVTISQAQANMDVIARDLSRAYPESNRDRRVLVTNLAKHVVGNVESSLLALLAAVGLVLLVACANVSNLVIGRAAARRKELTIRRALGASRRRIAQQLLTESVMLALLGGAVGLGAAWVGIKSLGMLLPGNLPRLNEIGIDSRVLVFTAAASLVTGILCGLLPALATNRLTLNGALKEGGRAGSGGPSRLRDLLVVAEISLALMLSIGAGLMAKSLWQLLQVTPGFSAEQILTAQIALPRSRFPDSPEVGAFYQQILDRVRNLPAVKSAGITAYLPLSGNDNSWAFEIEGRPPLPVGQFISTGYRPVTEGYFETMAIPLIQGRGITKADSPKAPMVVVINESLAKTFFPGVDPIGHRLRLNESGNDWRTIVGVVGDVKYAGLDHATTPELYFPVSQSPYSGLDGTIVMKTMQDPIALAAALRREVAALDQDQPVFNIRSMDEYVSGTLGLRRFRAELLGGFALVALLMAVIGIYGMMNYSVSQRTRELGIRLALGAKAGDILRLIMGQATWLILLGIGVGLLGAWALTRLMTTLLYGITPSDLATFGGSSVILAIAALLASYFPARRATRVDPMITLKQE